LFGGGGGGGVKTYADVVFCLSSGSKEEEQGLI
jgi:hypothetical protein